MSDDPLLDVRRPARHLPGDDGDVRCACARRLLHARPRAARHRRRSPARANRRPGAPSCGLVRRPGRGRRPTRLRFDGIDLLRCQRARIARASAAARIAMVLQDPKFSLNPVMTVGEQIAETLPLHHRRSGRRRRPTRGARDAGGRAHPRSRARLRPLSARGLRRHGPARDDRHDADRRARPPDRRRADLGARRHGADAGAGDHRRPGARARHGADPHQPRPQPGRVVLRPRAGHVCRPDRRDLRGRRAGTRRSIPTRAACSPRCPRSTSRRAELPQCCERDPAWLAELA